MAQEKTTRMLIKLREHVKLECPCCFKKVKKILCKFPQIRDQFYDEKTNTVTIIVRCCHPEKFRDKLCCKGCKVFKSIEIIPPPEKPKPPPPAEKPPEKPKPPPPAEKPPEKPKPPPPAEKPPEKPKPPPPAEKPPEKPKPPPTPPPPAPVPAYPVKTCCWSCYEGYGGGPCYHGYGVPPPPRPCFEGYYGYGYKPCQVSRCDYYFSEENPQACSIM